MCNILRIANAILLSSISIVSSAYGEIVNISQYQTRYLQQQDDTTTTAGYKSPYQISNNNEEDIEIINETEESSTSPEDVVDQRQDIPDTTAEVTIPIQVETRKEDAIIRGIVYMDGNKNSIFERDMEAVIPNAIVKLFTCSRGSMVGITRTNDDGIYSFTISGSLLPTLTQVCHYLQFTVTDTILYNAEFSTPMNGETNDIYVGRGEKMFDVNAGVYGATPSPTTSWGTWMPTMDGTMPPSASIPVTPPTSDQPTFKPSPAPVIPPPTTSAPSLSPVTDAPTTPQSNATMIEEQEDIVTPTETFEVRSTVLVELGNLNSQMNDDDTVLFESVCDDFLNENLVLATPPIYNVTCDVISQTVAEERRRRRYLKSSSHLLTTSLQRALAGSLTTEVEVTGIVEQTDTVQEPADVPFDDLLVGTFNVQGEFFIEALKEESLSESSTFETSEYFAQVDSVKATTTYEGSGVEESVGDNDNDSFFTKGVIAAIVAGGVILIVLILIVIRKGKRRRASSSAAKASSESKASPSTRKPSLARRLSGSFGARNVPPPPPTISSSPSKSVRTYITDDPTSPIRSLTYVEPSASAMSRDAMDGEFEAVDSGLSTPPPSPPKITPKHHVSKSTSNRIRRDVWAPSGKLGVMVANTSGYGPAIHTIRPGSPLEGLVFVSDIIAAINDVDTKHFTAEQITQVMKDTALEARKITVLSAHKG